MASRLVSMALGETQTQITLNAAPTLISDLPAGEVGIFIGGSVSINLQVTVKSAIQKALEHAREQKFLAPAAAAVKVVTILPETREILSFADNTALNVNAIQLAWDDTYAANPNASLQFDAAFEQLRRYLDNYLKNLTSL